MVLPVRPVPVRPPAIPYDNPGDRFLLVRGRFMLLLQVWPKPEAWTKSIREGEWHSIDPDLDVDVWAMHENPRRLGYWPWERNAMAEFIQTIPSDLRDALRPVPQRQWQMLRLVASCPRTRDLLETNLPLAFCLTDLSPFRGGPLRDAEGWIRLLSRCRQRRILQWLGFPESESARRSVRKLAIRCLSIQQCLGLRDALRDRQTARLLAHLPRINTGVLALVGTPPLVQRISPTLLNEVCGSQDEDLEAMAARLARETLTGMDVLGASPNGLRFRSRAHLHQLHEEVLEDLRAHQEDGGHPFPPPPFPGTDDIVPLTSSGMMREEGQEQRNCVASYTCSVIHGSYYLYRVLEPERATLSLKRRGRVWVIHQIKARRNRKVKPDTVRAAKHWLSRARDRLDTLG